MKPAATIMAKAPPQRIPKLCIAKTAAMKTSLVLVFAHFDIKVADNGQPPPIPNPSQKRKKQSLVIADFAVLRNDSADAIEQIIISNSVIPYTLFLLILSPSHQKNNCPASVPHNATPFTAAFNSRGKFPSFGTVGS